MLKTGPSMLSNRIGPVFNTYFWTLLFLFSSSFCKENELFKKNGPATHVHIHIHVHIHLSVYLSTLSLSLSLSLPLSLSLSVSCPALLPFSLALFSVAVSLLYLEPKMACEQLCGSVWSNQESHPWVFVWAKATDLISSACLISLLWKHGYSSIFPSLTLLDRPPRLAEEKQPRESLDARSGVRVAHAPMQVGTVPSASCFQLPLSFSLKDRCQSGNLSHVSMMYMPVPASLYIYIYLSAFLTLSAFLPACLPFSVFASFIDCWCPEVPWRSGSQARLLPPASNKTCATARCQVCNARRAASPGCSAASWLPQRRPWLSRPASVVAPSYQIETSYTD